jgi:hypothetical protein
LKASAELGLAGEKIKNRTWIKKITTEGKNPNTSHLRHKIDFFIEINQDLYNHRAHHPTSFI